MLTRRLADRLGSLRVRLACAMLLVLVAALALSSALDTPDVKVASAGHRLLTVLQREPYQDGLVLAAYGAAVAALIWIVSAWSLAPLSRASREAAMAGPGHPGMRISASSLPTEMRPLVAAVNGALDRLEAAYAAERRFTADAAHELRTPLAVLTLRLQRLRLHQAADLAPDQAGIDQDLRHMNRLVGQLLDLARKQAAGGAGPEMQPVNLCRIAREAAATILPMAEAARRTLTLDLPDHLAVHGRADDLRDMVVNLLENALAHGVGEIRITGQADAMRCILDVADEGPGLPEALRQAVFERFRKAVPGSPGTGLGLAIVREVVASHGGHVAFQPGPGCLVRVDLPGA